MKITGTAALIIAATTMSQAGVSGLKLKAMENMVSQEKNKMVVKAQINENLKELAKTKEVEAQEAKQTDMEQANLAALEWQAQNLSTDMEEKVDEQSKSAAQSMWEGAVDVEKAQDVEVPADSPFHFDLASLAQGLSQQASAAAHVTKLRNHVDEAEQALKTHEKHVTEIQELLGKAEGQQKTELTQVLTSAQSHVKELKKTVDKAHKHLEKQMSLLDKQERDKLQKEADDARTALAEKEAEAAKKEKEEAD